MLPGESDAAMQLDRIEGDLLLGLAHCEAGQGDQLFRNVLGCRIGLGRAARAGQRPICATCSSTISPGAKGSWASICKSIWRATKRWPRRCLLIPTRSRRARDRSSVGQSIGRVGAVDLDRACARLTVGSVINLLLSTPPHLNLSPRTLEKMRVVGEGPPFCKFGRRVAYVVKDLDAWAANRRCSSTSDPACKGPKTCRLGHTS